MAKLSKVRLYRLFQLAQQLLVLEPQIAEGSESLEPFLGVFGITSICLFDASAARLFVVGSSGGELEDRTRAAYVTGQDEDDPVSGITIRHVVSGGRIAGTIAFKGLEDPPLTAGPLVSLASAIHKRTCAYRNANPAPAAVAAEIEVFRSATFDVMGDEVKNALTTILTAVGGLREAGPLRPEQFEMARMVEEEASRLGSVISWLDRIARQDEEEIRPQMDRTDISALVAQTVEECSKRSLDRHIAFARSGAVLSAFADAEFIRFVLNQVLDSACRYSVPGSSVRVKIGGRNGLVEVSVSSESDRIPSHERPHPSDRSELAVRDPSFAADFGLGLSVARKIAVAHGGSLDFDRERMAPDRVAFLLSLPRAVGRSRRSRQDRLLHGTKATMRLGGRPE